MLDKKELIQIEMNFVRLYKKNNSDCIPAKLT